MAEQLEVTTQRNTIRILTVGIKKGVVRQLPRKWELSRAERQNFEPVCWISGNVLDKDVENAKAVLGHLRGTPIVWVIRHGYKMQPNMDLAYHDGEATRDVPFAVVA
jgi:hypothetical protein